MFNWAFLIAELVKNLPIMQETLARFWVGKICWRRDRLLTPVFLGFPCGSAGKESACNVGDLRSIPGLGRCPGEGNGYPFQYSGLENSVDCIVYGVAKSWTQLSDFHFHFFFLKKEVAAHSSILAWEMPWTEEPRGLQFMGSQRVGHDLATEHEHTRVI